MSSCVFACAKPVKLLELKQTIGTCAKVMDSKSKKRNYTMKILNCVASILRQQTVHHKRITTVTQKVESRKPASLPHKVEGIAMMEASEGEHFHFLLNAR